MSASEAEQLRMALADIVLDAVLMPGVPGLETVSRDALDRARMMIDHTDIAAAACRARDRQKTIPAPDKEPNP